MSQNDDDRVRWTKRDDGTWEIGLKLTPAQCDVMLRALEKAGCRSDDPRERGAALARICRQIVLAAQVERN